MPNRKRLQANKPNCSHACGDAAESNHRPRNLACGITHTRKKDGGKGKQHHKVIGSSQNTHRNAHPLGIFTGQYMRTVKRAASATCHFAGGQRGIREVARDSKRDRSRHKQEQREGLARVGASQNFSQQSFARRYQQVNFIACGSIYGFRCQHFPGGGPGMT